MHGAAFQILGAPRHDSIAAPTHVAEARSGDLNEFVISPEQLGVEPSSLDGLGVSSAGESLALIQAAMSGDESDSAKRARNIIALNAGAALHVAGLATDIETGVHKAMTLLESGAAWDRLQQLANLTSGF